MGKTLRGAMALTSMAALALSFGVSHLAAASDTLECGLFRDYVAPDPIGSTPGSITFGLNGTPETIAPDATLVPPTDTNLAGLQGGRPTGITVTRDAGVITALEFAAACTISGVPLLVPDLFGPGQDAYVIADRVFAPVDLIATNAGLAALIGTAADSGSTFLVTFQINLSTGVSTGFNATTTLSGAVALLAGGDIQVGPATLPDQVIGASARADLEDAADLGVPATVVVDGIGILDQSAPGDVTVDITLTVTFVAPTPQPTSTDAPLPNTAMGGPGLEGSAALDLAILALLGAVAVGAPTLRGWHRLALYRSPG